jgi:hypothetical protein
MPDHCLPAVAAAARHCAASVIADKPAGHALLLSAPHASLPARARPCVGPNTTKQTNKNPHEREKKQAPIDRTSPARSPAAVGRPQPARTALRCMDGRCARHAPTQRPRSERARRTRSGRRRRRCEQMPPRCTAAHAKRAGSSERAAHPTDVAASGIVRAARRQRQRGMPGAQRSVRRCTTAGTAYTKRKHARRVAACTMVLQCQYTHLLQVATRRAATCNTPHATSRMPRAACRVQQATHNMPRKPRAV